MSIHGTLSRRRRGRTFTVIFATLVVIGVGVAWLALIDNPSGIAEKEDKPPASLSRTTGGSKGLPPGEPVTGPYPKAILKEVVEGSSVWETVSDHLLRYCPYLTPGEHVVEVDKLVRLLQFTIDIDPTKTVRDLNRVPIDYSFYMSDARGYIGPNPRTS